MKFCLFLKKENMIAHLIVCMYVTNLQDWSLFFFIFGCFSLHNLGDYVVWSVIYCKSTALDQAE